MMTIVHETFHIFAFLGVDLKNMKIDEKLGLYDL